MKKSDLKNGKKSLHLLDEDLLTQTTCDLEDLEIEDDGDVTVYVTKEKQDENS